MKRIICLILLLLLLLPFNCIFLVNAQEIGAADDHTTRTIYFENKNNWENVYAICSYVKHGTAIEEYPFGSDGIQMNYSSQNEDGTDIYVAEIPSNVTDIIFSNGKLSSTQKSNVSLQYDVLYYKISDRRALYTYGTELYCYENNIIKEISSDFLNYGSVYCTIVNDCFLLKDGLRFSSMDGLLGYSYGTNEDPAKNTFYYFDELDIKNNELVVYPESSGTYCLSLRDVNGNYTKRATGSISELNFHINNRDTSFEDKKWYYLKNHELMTDSETYITDSEYLVGWSENPNATEATYVEGGKYEFSLDKATDLYGVWKERESQTIAADDSYYTTTNKFYMDLNATVNTNAELSFESDNENVAKAIETSYGTVIGIVKPGKANITISAPATYYDGKAYKLTKKQVEINVSKEKNYLSVSRNTFNKEYGSKKFYFSVDNSGPFAKIINNNTDVVSVRSTDGSVSSVSDALVGDIQSKSPKTSVSFEVSIKGYGKAILKAYVPNNTYYKTVEKTITITIVPRKVKKLNAVTTSAGHKLTLKWKRDKTVTGYQAQISQNKSFNGKTNMTVSKKKNSALIKHLVKGRKYHVRVRAYKKVSGHKYYGAWKTTSIKAK